MQNSMIWDAKPCSDHYCVSSAKLTPTGDSSTQIAWNSTGFFESGKLVKMKISLSRCIKEI